LFRNLEILRIMFQSMLKVKSQLHNANSTLIIIYVYIYKESSWKKI
jgi:hypothetical protein